MRIPTGDVDIPGRMICVFRDYVFLSIKKLQIGRWKDDTDPSRKCRGAVEGDFCQTGQSVPNKKRLKV